MITNNSDELIYITKRPLWHYIIAVLLYSSILPMINKMVDLFYHKKGLDGLYLVTIFFVCVCAGGLTFKKRIYVDSVLKNIRFNFILFGIRLMKDTIFKNVKYVSVYKNQSDRDFEIKIWLTETKKETISVFFNAKSAFKFASNIAVTLNIDLLDATEKGNFIWIEKENLNN